MHIYGFSTKLLINVVGIIKSHLVRSLPIATSTDIATSSTSTTTSVISKTPPPKLRQKRAFDASRYSTRLIALKFAYLGGNYNGFEHQANNPTPLPTIEHKLFEALLKSHLVAPIESNELEEPKSLVQLWPGEDATQYSKGGRTDRGVSAFGQVVGVRVRSNRPVTPSQPSSSAVTEGEGDKGDQEVLPTPEFDPIKDELPYVQILNRLLPHDIRVLSWAPNPPPDFSARFNCRGRHYKYFFSSPAIAPRGASSPSSFTGHLDIARMQEAASYFLGEHDFRNFCKLDASKQINNFKRKIYESSIEELQSSWVDGTGEGPRMYYFNLRGSAFLWHQVRHMIAILFLIGQRLEEPGLIRELLDVDKNPRKPQYEMADDRALVLWECYFPEGELNWMYPETDEKDGLMDIVWMGWHGARLEETLRRGLVGVVEDTKRKAIEARKTSSVGTPESVPPVAQYKGHILVDGGSRVLHRGKYIPVMNRAKMEDVEVLNEKYRKKKPERVSGKGKARRAADAAAEEAAEAAEAEGPE